jgi:hypothetical protein
MGLGSQFQEIIIGIAPDFLWSQIRRIGVDLSIHPEHSVIIY